MKKSFSGIGTAVLILVSLAGALAQEQPESAQKCFIVPETCDMYCFTPEDLQSQQAPTRPGCYFYGHDTACKKKGLDSITGRLIAFESTDDSADHCTSMSTWLGEFFELLADSDLSDADIAELIQEITRAILRHYQDVGEAFVQHLDELVNSRPGTLIEYARTRFLYTRLLKRSLGEKMVGRTVSPPSLDWVEGCQIRKEGQLTILSFDQNSFFMEVRYANTGSGLGSATECPSDFV
ncbi:MAG: hypothetical protein HY747_12260, partial [Elusimicrobia bacterium]|nr:hypothetical protein [Elusimicrobiota bacterium]